MNRLSELYAAGYVDACNGLRINPLEHTPSYAAGFADGLADSSCDRPDVVLSPSQAASILGNGFSVSQEPARRPKSPVPIENNERGRQAVLFGGLDCLPGQGDLFEEGTLR